MKKKLMYVGLFFVLIFSCKKGQVTPLISTTLPPATDTLSLTAAKAYVNSTAAVQTAGTGHNFSLSRLAIPWEKAELMPNRKSGYWLVSLQDRPVMNMVEQGYRKLALLRDSTGQIQARILEIIPDGIWYQRRQKVSTTDFTGRIFVYDEAYRLLSGNVYASGKQIGQIKATQQPTSPQNGQSRTLTVAITPACVWYDSSYIDADGVVTVYSEQDCSYTVTVDDGGVDLGSGDYAGGGGGGGGDAASAPEVANLPGENGPGVNAVDYTKCFGTMPVNSSTRMQVTVYVQEPLPGTSFNIGPNSVGHTAISLTQTTGGTSITQTLGFYPDASGKDKMHAPGKIVDNSGLDYQVSISFQVDALQFANLINYLDSPLPAYDITAFNCTGYVNAACQYAGINLPNPYTTIGLPYPDGTMSQAMTPAGLGNSIRNMEGQPGVNTNGGSVPRGSGPCN